MKINTSFYKNTLIAAAICIGFVACDKDFESIDSDIVNEEIATNFNTTSEKLNVISYTDKLNPVQTNNLGIYGLGVYDDPLFGRTTASIVTQLSNSTLDPSFGDDVILESVVLTIPYSSTITGADEDGFAEYELDSIFSTDDTPASINLSIYENSYFLRDFDPNGDFDSNQAYFSDKSLSDSEQITDADLESHLIARLDNFEFSNELIVITDDEGEVTDRLSPRLRVVWNDGSTDASEQAVVDYWKQKIIDQEGMSTLSNSNNFNDYFRGIYFKAEPNSEDKGSLALLNIAQQDANITLNYSFNSTNATTGDVTREDASYVLTFANTRVNFLENNFTTPISNGDNVNGDEKLYLKGGEGAVAGIKLFEGAVSDDDDTTDNTFEAWRKQYVNLNEDGEFESSKRLVNEANLIFYVDQDVISSAMASEEIPDRLYLYDKSNGLPLADYVQDIQNNTFPQLSIVNHLGVLERDETTNEGIRYKMRITTHINNLLLNNTENVELGIAVSSNVNLEGSVPQFQELTTDTEEKTLPVSSITSPRSVVLFGNNTANEDKKLYLEIFYTCLETDIDCPNN